MNEAAASKRPVIRDLKASDEAGWRRLWRGFMDYYGLTLDPGVEDFTWARLLSDESALTCRLAIRGGEAVGFAIHQHHPSTWVMGDDGYLEDLFVAPEARGAGVARALMDDLVAIGRARGWKRLYWLTEQTNATARALYESYTRDDGHVRYRMTL